MKREFRKETMANLRSMKPEDLAKRGDDTAEELKWLRFKLRGKQLDKPTELRRARKALARIRTLQGESASKARKEPTS